MSNLSKIVGGFSPISLDEMDDVKLMSRTDTKFAFKANKLPLLLEKLLPFYRVLAIDGELIHDYKSLYYDTDDRKFFLDHHNGRVNRNKIRFREYVGSKLTFLEIKLKNNKGKTIKKRMKVDKITKDLSEKQQKYIQKIIGKPMDVNLTYKNDEGSGDMNHIVIAEVKQERMSRSSDFMRIAKEMHILPIRISKYCMTTLALNPKLKQNRFKEKVLFINKLKQA